MSQFECRICGSKEFNHLLHINKPDRFERSVGIADKGYIRRWVECKNCGTAANLHIAGNLKKLKNLGQNYYEVDLGKIDLSERYDLIMQLPEDKSDNKKRVKRIKAFLSEFDIVLENSFSTIKRRKVLDIGAGLGVFLSSFIDDQWSGVAIEPDPNAYKHLEIIFSEERYSENIDIYHGLFNAQKEFSNFDLVTLNKVVEHIEDPVSFLKVVRFAIKHGKGIMYIEVPDKLTIGNRSQDDNILGALHYNLYDPRSLAQLLDASGYDPLSICRLEEPSGKITVYAFAILKGSFPFT
jgi:2-polyprenyl-3-methyl-5-hydroxy-6-metoxy-1,4-benzoquinol methylase